MEVGGNRRDGNGKNGRDGKYGSARAVKGRALCDHVVVANKRLKKVVQATRYTL